MGRPISKKFFGATNASNVSSESNGTSFGIVMSAFIPAVGEAGYISGAGGSSAVDSIISRQVGSRKYVVTNAQGSGRVELGDQPSPVKGFGYLVGYIMGTGGTSNEKTSSGTTVAIKKLTARKAYGFDGHVYAWTAQNDSTQDYIELTLMY